MFSCEGSVLLAASLNPENAPCGWELVARCHASMYADKCTARSLGQIPLADYAYSSVRKQAAVERDLRGTEAAEDGGKYETPGLFRKPIAVVCA